MAELELSNSSINSDDLKQMFSPSSITSNLRYLNLSMCHIPLIVDQAVIDSLASRPLELLDLSHNNKLTFDFGNSSELCTTLTTLILHDSSITILDLPPFCSSLQFVDLSGKQEMATELKQCVNNIAYIELRNVFYFARVMHLDRLITDTKAYLTSNCHVFIMSDELRTVKHKIIEFYFSYNSISQFEILFDFVYAGNSLKLISLSHNSIENINKRAFFYLDSLEKIDLSHNQLSQMSDNKGTFQDLFLNNQNLTSIDLSSNGLSHLPDETFLLNLNLAEIGLSRNAFSQLSFNFSYLNDLSVLDMRFNKIKYLDSGSRQMVDLMYANNYLEKNFGKNTTLQILLEGNPFTCRCEALGFLEWFMSSPIVNSSYTCVIDGQKIPMPELAVQTAREECEKPKRRRRTIVLSTLLPIITLAAIIGAIIFSYRRYKRRQEQRLLEDKLRLIQEELTRFPYTVFLSYSSDDTEFVRQHIRPQMEVRSFMIASHSL